MVESNPVTFASSVGTISFELGLDASSNATNSSTNATTTNPKPNPNPVHPLSHYF